MLQRIRNRRRKGIPDKPVTTIIAKMDAAKIYSHLIPRPHTPSPYLARSLKNVLLIGDAASFVDILTGEGIYFALRSGEYAAMAISTALAKAGKEAETGSIYERLWKKESKWKDFFQGYMLQPVISNKHILNFTITRASHKQKNADVLAGVIAHKLPKSRLLYNKLYASFTPRLPCSVTLVKID